MICPSIFLLALEKAEWRMKKRNFELKNIKGI